MQTDPAAECKAYHAKMERSIDNLLKINKELEANNQLLQEEINQLVIKPTEPDRRDELIGLIAPYIVNMAKIKGREQKIYDICDLYNELYPEGVKPCQQFEKS